MAQDPSLTLLSWNVNGIRAAERKGFLAWLQKSPADIVAVQETKVSDPNLLSDGLRNPDGYSTFWHCATEKKGYSGVAMYTKVEPRAVQTSFGSNPLSAEGRVIELDFGKFLLLNIYFPNGGASDGRLRFKLKFYAEFLTYAKSLMRKKKSLVICGDVNTAHHEIDLARPKENVGRSGFMPIEREWLDKFEAAGLIDTYRLLNPMKVQYSWWDQKTRARERNVGWRIDYFYVTPELKSQVRRAFIRDDLPGSDHCPVGLELSI